MRPLNALSVALIVVGLGLALLAPLALQTPVAAAPLLSLTETAEPPTATPEPPATATPEPVATATPEPGVVATPEPGATSAPGATAVPEPEPERPRRADPAVTKRGGAGEARVGDLVNFTITVFNRGNGDATGVTVIDSLPPFLELVSAATNRGVLSTTPGSVTLRIDRLSPDMVVTLTIVTRAIAPAPPGSANVVTLSSEGGGDDPVNNSASVPIFVTAGASDALPTTTATLPAVTPEAPTTTAAQPTPIAPTATSAVLAQRPAQLPVTGINTPGGQPALALLGVGLMILGLALSRRR